MKHVAFHSNQLGIRGTEVALYDYAFYNESILGNKSYIISDANKDLQTLNKFKNKFEVFLYNQFEDCFPFISEKNITHIYYQKAGDFDSKIVPGIKNIVHAVFQNKDPHGDVYCYISEWLANKASMPGAFVPYIVDMPQPNSKLRSKLDIPAEQIVIGRYGGYSEFNLQFVYESIYKILTKRTDLTFVFMNTRPFGKVHPNIIFVESTYNLQHKSNFIDMCDYMIHGRWIGESFGLAISEFLFHDKPVISWKDGEDLNHIEMLGEKGLWYEDKESLDYLFADLCLNTKNPGYYKTIVDKFSPTIVMEQFNQKFLN